MNTDKRIPILLHLNINFGVDGLPKQHHVYKYKLSYMSNKLRTHIVLKGSSQKRRKR